MAPIMTAQDRSSWMTVPAMARRLDISEANLKRRIRDGKPVQVAPGQFIEVEAEMIERPQGHEWRVRVKGPMPAISTAQEQTDSVGEAPLSSDQGTAPPFNESALNILDMLLQSSLDAERRQAETVAALRERVGRAEAAVEAQEARAAQYAIDYGEMAERAIRAEKERDDLAAALARARAEAEALKVPWYRRIFG